ncbi:MAG: type II toxin-antitoxin system VapC family toxin [Solirubrobacteraceae bacterium]
MLIVDTHAALWFLSGDRRLSQAARALIEDEHIDRRLSAVSVWEVAVKRSIGKLKASARFHELLYEQGLFSLPVTDTHAVRFGELPFHHRDPFDRMLVAQAQIEDMSILSADPRLEPYDVRVVW